MNQFIELLEREMGDMKRGPFARKIGVDRNTLDHWFSGRSSPTLSSVEIVMDNLGGKVAFLMPEKGDKP